jgi:hypothetical protein
MDEQSARSLYGQRIETLIESLLPNGAGTITESNFRHAMNTVAEIAFSSGQDYALSNLLTVNDLAELFGVNASRIRAIAKRHAEFGVGWKIPKTNQWLFQPDEIEKLRPKTVGRPKSSTVGKFEVLETL